MTDTEKELEAGAMADVGQVEEILRRWDPIGVRPGDQGPIDEYDSYALHVVSMVAQDCSPQQLSTHLGALRTDTMGLKADPDADSEIANAIIDTLRSRSA